MVGRPQLEYTGQSSEEVLEHIGTHSDFSVLGGLRWCIAAKARALGGEDRLTEEERIVLAECFEPRVSLWIFALNLLRNCCERQFPKPQSCNGLLSESGCSLAFDSS